MKVSYSDPQRNPEQVSRQMDSLLDGLRASVRSAANNGDSFDSAERTVLTTVLQLGHQALELLLSLQDAGDLGQEIPIGDSKTSKRSEKKSVTSLRSIFGQHSFEQFTYSTGANRSIDLRPISARLSLPARRWSYLLQEFSKMLGVDQSYDQAMKNLGQILHSDFSVDTAERVNQRMGSSAGEYLADLPLPDPDSEGKLLVATADCKGVPLVK